MDNYCDIRITFKDKTTRDIHIDLLNQLIIDKNFFIGTLGEFSSIEDINIKFKCKDFFLVELRNDISADHFGISSYANFRSTIAIVKIYDIKLIHINDIDINHLESYKSSPLIVRCNVNELYTGVEYFRNDNIPVDEYKVDIRRDSVINHLSASGVLKINIQESTIKECDILKKIAPDPQIKLENEKNCHIDINQLKAIDIWNGSNVHLLKITAPTEVFKVTDSIVNTVTLGETKIKTIKLKNELIQNCSIIEESINNNSIEKWRLIKNLLRKKESVNYT
jgi:hypothetical protein